jgi:NDP-sugar pyrophosphorylase family protein
MGRATAVKINSEILPNKEDICAVARGATNNLIAPIENIKVLLLVGGKGTRLSSVSGDISKGLITIDQDGKISGTEHSSMILKNLELNDVVLLVRHKSDQYIEFAEKHGYAILHQNEESGTGGALEEAITEFGADKQYLVMATDTYLYATDVARLLSAHLIGNVTWGVSIRNPDLDMDSYYGLVLDSQNNVIGDVKQHWWHNYSVDQMQLVTKGAVQIVDPMLYLHSVKVFKRLAGNPSAIDLYWDIMPLMEEQNRRRINKGQNSVVKGVIFDHDIIDYGTPERLAITRARYDIASTKRD